MPKSEKRYQVFVSSTYSDLIEERQEVMHALLELDCIPSGMELFPAADEDQWSIIGKVIQDCDYYLVIIGGRYGSEDNTGMSYTEKEYNRALKLNKPIIAFLHQDPGKIIADKTDQDPQKQKKLGDFRKICEQKMCKYWTDAKDLGSKVSRSLIKLIKDRPAIGWVRADQVLGEDADKEILELKRENERLSKELIQYITGPPPDIEKYSQGEEKVEIYFTFTNSYGGKPYPVKDFWRISGSI